MVGRWSLLRSALVDAAGRQGRAVADRTAHRPRTGSSRTDIDPTIGTGRVNVGGEDWAARSREPIAAGTKIRSIGADGIVLEVTHAHRTASQLVLLGLAIFVLIVC